MLADDATLDPAVRRWHSVAAGLGLSHQPCLRAAVPHAYSPGMARPYPALEQDAHGASTPMPHTVCVHCTYATGGLFSDPCGFAWVGFERRVGRESRLHCVP